MKLRWWRQRKDEELNTEIRSHLDEAIRDRLARGETPEQARINALREFRNVGLGFTGKTDAGLAVWAAVELD